MTDDSLLMLCLSMPLGAVIGFVFGFFYGQRNILDSLPPSTRTPEPQPWEKTE